MNRTSRTSGTSRVVPAPGPASSTPGTGRAPWPAAVAAATLALGYADLARGGETIGAILLVVGYAVALPWAILRAGRRA